MCVCVCVTCSWCGVQEVKKLEGRLEKVSSLVAWVNQEEALFKFQVSSFPLLAELKVGVAAAAAASITTCIFTLTLSCSYAHLVIHTHFHSQLLFHAPLYSPIHYVYPYPPHFNEVCVAAFVLSLLFFTHFVYLLSNSIYKHTQKNHYTYNVHKKY